MRCNPHPALRATLSQREKGGNEELGEMNHGWARMSTDGGKAQGHKGQRREPGIDSRKERKANAMADSLPVRHRTQTGNVRPPFSLATSHLFLTTDDTDVHG